MSDWKMDRKPSRVLMQTLRRRYGDGCILMQEIYEAYWDVCYCDIYGRRYARDVAIKDDQFLRMNARNQICQATHQGILKQVGRGVYCFI